MNDDDATPLANIRFHPFIVVIGSFYMSIMGRRVWTVELDSTGRTASSVIGLGLAGLGMIALTLAYREMARARTTINPREHSTALVTTGPYQFSRNPIYLGWFFLTLGLGVANASLFAVVVAVLMAMILHGAVVLGEEAYLATAFGDDYTRYRRAVRRWL